MKFQFYVGIDLGRYHHQVCIIDGEHKIHLERKIPATAGALTALVDLIGGFSQSIIIGMESPHGPLIELLLERGFSVYSINPKKVERFRDRYRVSGAKSDEIDAYVIARTLVSDLDCYRLVNPMGAALAQLREVRREDEELAGEKTRLTNRLQDALLRYYPQVVTLAGEMSDTWILELLEKASTPEQGRKMTRARVTRLLKKHKIRRLTVDEVLAVLREPPLTLLSGTTEAISRHVKRLVPRLRVVIEQRKQCSREIHKLLSEVESEQTGEAEHRDVAILLSLPGHGERVAATMLTEATEALAQRDYHALRTRGGAAPVTKRSGKKCGKHWPTVIRYARNVRLSNAYFYWALASLTDPHCRAHYARLRERGHSHPRALRSVADRLLRILVAMLRDGTLYDAGKPSPGWAQPTAGACTAGA